MQYLLFNHLNLRKSIWLLFIQLCAITGSAQISGLILDKSSGKPVPYASIWIEGEQIGTTSEEDGSFHLNVKSEDYLKRYLTISCVGYLKSKNEIAVVPIKVELSPASYLLKEVVVFSAKNTLTKKLDLLDKNQIRRWFGAISPNMMAHLYPYTEDFKTLPFLRKILLVSDSKINTAQFRLRLFEVADSGEPGIDLIEPMFAYAKKGRNYVTVDLTEQNFKVPEKGFFVACEWLILDRNKSFTKTYKEHTDKKINVIGYEPSIATTLPGKESRNWIYQSGTWKKTYDLWDGKTLNKNLPVEELLFQLVLSN